MTTQEVADKLVKMCSEGKFLEAIDQLYGQDIVNVEAVPPPGQSRETKGFAAVRGRSEWWTANHEVHSAKIEGPLVAGSHFAVVFIMDVTFKPESRRMHMEEVGVYKVADGKVVYEEFFYSM